MYSKINAHWQRSYKASGASWLITLTIGTEHGHSGGGSVYAGMPQARAVVDDFGTLVCVEAWK